MQMSTANNNVMFTFILLGIMIIVYSNINSIYLVRSYKYLHKALMEIISTYNPLIVTYFI